MSTPRFFTNEDVYGAVAPALRRYGFDAVSTVEAKRLGESDESQLEWAHLTGRIIVTFTVGHFAVLHDNWMRDGRLHAGLIVSAQRPIKDVVQRLMKLATHLSAEKCSTALSSWAIGRHLTDLRLRLGHAPRVERLLQSVGRQDLSFLT